MDFEQELRDSLQHSADALGSGDSSLEAVQSRGRRRKAWKAAGAGFALVLVVGVGAFGLASVVPTADDSPVAASTVATSQMPTTAVPDTLPPPSTVVAPPSTVESSSSTVVAPPTTAVGAVFPEPMTIEADQELVWIQTNGKKQVVYQGRYHAIASDGFGGLVFQVQISIEEEGRERAAIFRVLSGTTEPVVIVTQEPGHLIEMFGVEDVDGVPTLLYTDRTGMEAPETAQSMLVAYDLASGVGGELAVVGGWESGISSISYGGGLYVMDAFAESEVWFRYLDRDGNVVEPVGDPHPGCEAGELGCPQAPVMSEGRLVFYRSLFYDADLDLIDLPESGVVVLNDAGIVHYDPDETLLAAVGEFHEVVEFVSADLDTGHEDVLLQLEMERREGEDGAAFFDIDVEGEYLIVSDRKSESGSPPIMFIGRNGWKAAMPGVGRFPPAPFDLPSVITSPFG